MSVLDFIPVVGPAVGAAADMLTGASNAKAARDAFKNRYQDTVKDMKKAGLNPALAYGQGGGNPQTHDLPLPGEQMAKAAQMTGSALQAKRAADLTKAQTDLLLAQKDDLVQQTKLRNAEIMTHTGLMGAQGGLTMKQQDMLELSMKSLSLDNQWKEATLSDRIEMIRKDLEKRGVEISYLQLQKALGELTKPRLKAEADFFEELGKGAPYLNSAAQLLQMLRGR